MTPGLPGLSTMHQVGGRRCPGWSVCRGFPRRCARPGCRLPRALSVPAGSRLDSDPSDRLISGRTHSGSRIAGVPADIAQLVERNLAKVEVAGSSPVVRSKASCLRRRPCGSWRRPGALTVEWPRGEATACKAVYTGSNPVSTSSAHHERAIGAAVARFPDTEEVTGSIPVSPTSSKTAPDLRKRGSGAVRLWAKNGRKTPLRD